MYHFGCDCGEQINVRLSQAGTPIRCPGCGVTSTVPRVSDLKRESGDATPYFSDIDRLAQALLDRSRPFDGHCQQCMTRAASVHRPVTFEFLVKREVSDDEGIRPTLTPFGPGLALVVGASREHWKMIQFPLLFCEECHTEFTARYGRSSRARFTKGLALALLLGPILIGVLIFAAIVPCITVPAAVLLMAIMVRHQTRKRADPFVFETLRKIPLIGAVVSAEGECQIQIGDPQPYTRNAV
jgi:hypothetical protein